MLLGILVSSLLGNIFVGKGVIQTGYGTIRAGQYSNVASSF